MLHQIEHIALGGAQRIPPAVSVVVDDQDLALAAAVFQGATGAFPAIEPPADGLALEQRGAAGLTVEQVELGVTDSHALFLLWGLVAPALCHRSPLAFGDREAAAAQGRSRHGRGRGTPRDPCATAGASGIALSCFGFFTPPASRHSVRTARAV
jgi:hypothetical protein